MLLSQLANKKIAILGLGIENHAMVKHLFKKNVPCEITICDRRSEKEAGDKRQELIQGLADSKNQKLSWKFGKNYNKNLDKFDILFRSPGMPLSDPGIVEAIQKQKIQNSLASSALAPTPASTRRRRGERDRTSTSRSGKFKIQNYLYSPIKLFFDLCPTENIIGVTGTKGKGTTASLIQAIIRASGRRAFLGGNIGIAPFDFINKIKKNDWVILELSSFQLEDLEKSPKIAVITNFYKEHLAAADPRNPNYHQSPASYWRAKANIFKHLPDGGKIIINYGLLKKTLGNKKLAEGANLFHFHSYDNAANSFFIDNSHLHLLGSSFKAAHNLPGEHNLENIAAASLTARLADSTIPEIQRALRSYKGLEHRLEHFASFCGIDFYDDSFATTPESAITALRSFGAPLILIAGGAEKNSAFGRLAKEIKKRVKFLILLKGASTPRIKERLWRINFPASRMVEAASIGSAVAQAYSSALPGDKVLLSPACASFGMFENYKERGRLFKQAVFALAKKRAGLKRCRFNFK